MWCVFWYILVSVFWLWDLEVWYLGFVDVWVWCCCVGCEICGIEWYGIDVGVGGSVVVDWVVCGVVLCSG